MHVHWAHATGFHAQTYSPLLTALAQHYSVSAWDMRGHGETRANADPAELLSWQVLYDDLLACIDTLPEPVVLAGHSVGAVCSLVAAARRPQQVRALILVDPILMTGPASVGFGLLKRAGQGHRHPLVAGALRRRHEFPDRQSALDNYRGKAVFSSWAPDMLEQYVAGGFRDCARGVTLRCAPEWEARQYATTEHDAWRHVAALQCPVLLIGAARGSTIFPGAIARFRQLCPSMEYRKYSGTSHFLPMEAAGRLEEDILSFVAGCVE